MALVLEVIKDLWKGFLLVILSIALLASSFLVPFHSFLPAWTHQDDEFPIGPSERRSIRINLVLGSVVRGMIVTWNVDKCIVFSLEDSAGNIVLDESIARDRYFFEFQPSKSDSYVLVLNNIDGSAENGVYWIFWSYYYNFLFLLSGVALYIVGVLFMFREEKMIRGKFADVLEEASRAVRSHLF